MHLMPRELTPFVLAFVGGWGGVLSTIMWWQIIDLLNTRRPPDDQIPAALLTFQDYKKHHHGLVFKHIQEFHRQFPESRLYFWYWASICWMFAFILAAAMVLLSAQQR
jgi:hypothetical protein